MAYTGPVSQYLTELYRQNIPTASELRTLNKKVKAIQTLRNTLIDAANDGKGGIDKLSVKRSQFNIDELGGVLINEKGYTIKNYDEKSEIVDIYWG